MADHDVALTVNGEPRRGRAEARTTLADFLRDELGLTGTHLACEHGVCGSCTVLFDGDAVRACLLFAVQAAGHEVVTIEGIAPAPGGPDRGALDPGAPDRGALGPVQQAFMECHGLQCGFCTPGFVVSVSAFLDECSDPTDAQILDGLSGNLCRCTGYQGIVAAVRRAVELRSGALPAAEPSESRP